MDPNQPPYAPPAQEQAPPMSYFPPQQAAPPPMAALPPPAPASALPPPPPPSAPSAFAASSFAPAVPAPNAEAGPSTVPAVPVRPLKGPGSRGGRGGSGRGRGRGGSRGSDGVSEYAMNRPARIRKPAVRHGVTDDDYAYGSDEDEYVGSSSNNHYQSSHNRHSSGHRQTFNFEGKIKLNLKGGNARGGKGRGGRYSSFLGEYDRELDTDEEEIVFEEQFILRMPEGEASEKLRGMVKEKGAKKGLEDVWFKFKDSRRAVFKLADQLYSAKLVDLPSIIEAQKTLDGKQMFKAADISQMLVVSNPISNESEAMEGNGGGGKLNIDDYIWPHGVTPPMRHVRKRRYRKRISRRTIEVVEEEVERMLAQDSRAEKVTYDIIEDADPDASDSEFLTPKSTPQTLPQGSQYGDESEMGDGDNEGGATSRNGNDDGDDNLAAELARGLKELEDSDEEEAKGGDGDDESDEDDNEASERASDDEEEGSSAADSEDEEAVEIAQRQKLLTEEIRDLETAVSRKRTEIAASSNAIIKKRFEDALKKLQADLDLKLGARSTITREKEKRRREDEEERERETGLKESKEEEERRLRKVESHLVVPPLPPPSSAAVRTGGGLVIPPLPSMASSSARPTAAMAPPKVTLGAFAPAQPSSLSTVTMPPVGGTAPGGGGAGGDLESQMEAAMDDSDEDQGEDSVRGGTEGGDEDEEDLFGDDDDEGGDDDADMEEVS